jgi:hypothetical protein
MSRLDIVGLSLAETALVLLFVLLGAFAPAYAHLKHIFRSDNAEIAHLNAQLAKAQQNLSTAQDHLAMLQQEFAADRPKLRSRATPSCFELNKTSDRWLFTLVVRGADKYEVDGRIFTFPDLLKAHSREIEQGHQDDCRFSIKIASGDDVSGMEYEAAEIRLGQVFYMTQAGR